MTAANIAVVLLAAGLSRRMGQDKLLRRLPNGKRLLEDRIQMIIAAGAVPYVALSDGPERSELVVASSAIPVLVPGVEQGMGVSISAAVHALPPTTTGILIMLADLPDVTADNLQILMARFDGERMLRATSQDGTPGHPVIFPARLRSKLETLTGDQGAKSLLQSGPVDLFPLPDQNAIRDLDTPEDWKAWEQGGLKTPRR